MVEGEIDRLWRAFKAAPGSPAFFDLVRALLVAGRHGDAVRVCEMGLAQHAGDARAYLALGASLRGVGRLPDAQAALVRAVKLDPGDPACARALGELLLEQGEARRARELFAHALRRAPGDITLRELFERASSAAGLPALPDSVHAGGRATPLPPSPVHHPTRRGVPARADPSREDTFEVLEVVEVVPTVRAEAATDMRVMPAALEVALRAELTLSNLPVPGASSSPAARRTPPPAARPMAPPPRAPAPSAPAPAPIASVFATDPGREITDEISAQDIIVEPDPRAVAVRGGARAVEPMAAVHDVRTLAAPARRSGGRRLVVVLAIVLGLLGGAGGVGGFAWTRARRADRVAQTLADARRALARGDGEGYRTAVRLFERATAAAPDDAAVREQAAVARSLALLEADVGTAARVEATLGGLGETVAADAARAALRIAAGDLGVADEILRKEPGPRAGETLPYLRGLLAARRGDADARTILEAVATRFAKHAPTRIALAELDLIAGAADRANGEAEHARQAQPASLRPVVVSVLAQAYAGDPAAILGLLDGLGARLGKGSACERLLSATARSVALARAGKVPEARAAAERPGPEGCTDPLALLIWARAASAAGARASALEVVQKVRKLAPAALPVRTLEASILVEAGRGAEAERILGDAAGSSVEIDLLLARAAIAARSDARAIPLLERLLAKGPDRQDVRILLLRAQVRSGDATAAERVRALELAHPEDPDVALAAAEVALVGRDAAGAIERLTRVVARAPSAEASFRLGQALRLAARFGEAVDAFRAAFAVSPDFADALEAAASLELARGRLDDAQAIAIQLGAASGDAGAAALLRAEIDLARGDGAAALARLDALPAGEGASRRVTLMRARALARSGDVDGALRAVQPLLADPRDAEARALRGEIRRARPTERVGAAEDFDEALIVDPLLPEALLGRLEIALDRDEGGMIESLVPRTVTALQARLRPPSAHARLMVIRARDLVRAGRRHRPEAESLLTAATETAPLAPEPWFWLGKTVGVDDPRGRAALQRSVELQATGPLATEARRLLQ